MPVVYIEDVSETARQRAANRFTLWFRGMGLSQEQVGDRCGHNQAWVSRRLKVGPTIEELDELAATTGHDPGDFVTHHPVTFGVTHPVTEPNHDQQVAPGEEPAMLSSLSPSHRVLAGWCSRVLSDEEADAFLQDAGEVIKEWRRARQHGRREAREKSAEGG